MTRRICIYPECGWTGDESDTMMMKHGWPRNLCPECHGITEELTAYWPDLESVPAGSDPFLGEPLAGVSDGETLSRLVCDANLTPDDGNE